MDSQGTHLKYEPRTNQARTLISAAWKNRFFLNKGTWTPKADREGSKEKVA